MSSVEIPVRVCVALVSQGEVCLIHRSRGSGRLDQYSLPGGLVEPGEDVAAALVRELMEELDLDITSVGTPVLRWRQRQATTRPGSDTLFRREHLIHVLEVPDQLRVHIAPCEQDATDTTAVVWIPLNALAALHLYPDAGPALASYDSPLHAVIDLNPMGDDNYNWR